MGAKRICQLLTLPLLCWASLALAQDDPLRYLPGDADLVIRLGEPDRTVEKVAELAGKIQPLLKSVVEGQASQLGEVISHPTLTGVDQSRPWYLAIKLRGREVPTALFAIPAVNTTDFVAALPAGAKSVVHDRWVVYSPVSDIPVVAEGSSLAKTWDAPLKANLDAAELGVFVNVDGIVRAYPTEIETYEKQIYEFVDALRFLPMEQGVDIGAIAKLYARGADSLFDALRDTRHLSLTVRLEGGDVGIDQSIAFKPDSDTAKILAANPASRLDLVRSLPANQTMQGGFQGFSQDLIGFALEVASAAIKEQQQRDLIEGVFTEMKQVGMGEMAIGIDVQPLSDDGLFTGYNLMRVRDWEKYRDLMRKMNSSLNVMEVGNLRQTTEVERDAETYGAHKVDVVRVRQEQLPGTAGPDIDMQKLLFGDMNESRVAYLPEALFTIQGGKADDMRKLLANWDAQKKITLPTYHWPLAEKANAEMYVDGARMFAGVFYTIGKTGLIPIRMSEASLDGLNLKPSYAAMSIRCDGPALHTQVRVPVEQIQGFTRLFALVGAMQQGL